jgi:hypothetical protein
LETQAASKHHQQDSFNIHILYARDVSWRIACVVHVAVVVAVVSLHSRTSAAAAGPSFWNSVGFPALWLNDELLLKVLGHDASLRIAMIFKRI